MRRLVLPLFVALAACNGSVRTVPEPQLPTWAAAPPATSPHAVVLPESASPIGFGRMAKFPEPGWQIPRRIERSPDGERATYLMSEKGDEEMVLWSLSLATGERTVLLRAGDLVADPKAAPSREEELRAERQRRRTKGITEYAWAAKAPVLVVPSGGDVFVRDAAGKIVQLTKTDEPELDAKPCADGTRVAYVRGRELFVSEVATKKETQLTKGAPDGVTRGQSDFNAQEEFDEPSGFFWSPDCKTIAFLEVDERKVAEVPVVGYRGGNTDLMMQRYPRAGGVNPTVSLHLVDVTTKKVQRVTLSKDIDEPSPYLGRFRFSGDGKWLGFWALGRSQRKIALFKVEIGKKPEATSMLGWGRSADAQAWIDMPDFACNPRGTTCYFIADAEGHDHLYRTDFTTHGKEQITKGDYDVVNLAGVDEESRAYVNATKDEPVGRPLYRVDLDGKMERLTPERGWHDVVVSATGVVADVHSALDRPPAAVVFGKDVRHEIPIPRDADFDALRLRAPELVTVETPGLPRLHGAVLAPRQLEAGKAHPVVWMVYGGPGVQTVVDRWSPRLHWQHLADRGFFVMQFDNRGSAGRGQAFATPIAKELGKVELEDQLRALDWAKTKYPIDARRVGIYGHSYGGTMAAYAMLKAPGRFRSAISASPVTDWRLYDTGYTERYMLTPKENATGYTATDLEHLAGNLSGELLVVHALMDENVHFQHSADLVDALIKAKKPFEMFVFPGERHGYRSPAAREYAMGMVTRFLVRTLGTPASP